jgi:intracellular septation protein
MKILFDFLPVLLFFVTFKFYDDPIQGVLAATTVAIVASIGQVGFSWIRYRRVERMHLATLALILILGGATLLLQDEMFIKWKPTAVNWLFALVFWGSSFVGGKSLARRMMESKLQLPEGTWRRLNTSWVLFFLVLGALNLVVVYNFDTDTWVNFKLFGLMGLTLVFVLAQSLFLMRHVKLEDHPEEPG